MSHGSEKVNYHLALHSISTQKMLIFSKYISLMLSDKFSEFLYNLGA